MTELRSARPAADQVKGPCLFALDASRALGLRIAAALGTELQPHEERDFEDGEHKLRPLVDVRDRDCYVVHSLYGDDHQSPDDKLLRLLFFIATLRDCDAGRITAVAPYLCFARKDQRTQPHDPVTTRHVAILLEAAGMDRILTMDTHNVAAFQNAFRRPSEHLEAALLFAGHLAHTLAGAAVAVVSPDAGGVRRAHRLQACLQRRLDRAVDLAFLDKTRARDRLAGGALVGEVRDHTTVIIDDLISSGSTLALAAEACRQAGAAAVHAVATHGLFTGEAGRILGEAPLDSLIITDSVSPERIPAALAGGRTTVLDTAAHFAAAIDRLYRGESLLPLTSP